MIGAGLIIGIASGYILAFHSDKLPNWNMVRTGLAAWGMMPGCDIKGNISPTTGERIYHVPGQEHYRETTINRRYGERWFCSEAEARAAGWRKARR